ncbi:MAG: prepilin peptidase [Gemmatimonas sp.]|jgi:leader peptidase (prepilin peptidase)/N-methyltransferase|uniref:prepilin peptidase n=1 Tax=Gemmatimonas sp. TaxID=1962908 RepID=UPI0025BD6992|nr:A24 family peptidase [Gemmatimonas sp.]MCA2985462.1 prepilin peptidase [Gemmatimonas sp.]MCA2986578.1 prepilin peptidase [Gemmatimonas sp.]MCA2993893.1 prepilin peptidase [Gemmatimonas sp.]
MHASPPFAPAVADSAALSGLSTGPALASFPLAELLLVLLSAFVVGACFGSFLNVCIARWPLELSVVRPRSRCPRCERQIRWFENIPVLSWLLLRGQCAGCALPISVQYPLIEVIVGLGWTAAVYHFGVTLEAVRVATFATLLLGIAVTDAKHYLIPDGFTVSGLLLMLLFAVANVFVGEPSHFVSPWPAILGACVGAGAITIIGWLAEVIMKREAMGFGDTTLMAVVGAAVGAERSLLTIITGAFVGAVTFLLIVGPIVKLRTSRRGEAFAFPDVPFGVFLAPGALLTLLWGDALIRWYVERAFSA